MMFKGRKNTEETKRKKSEAMKKLWQNKEYSEKMLEVLKKINQDEEIRKKRSENMKKYWEKRKEAEKNGRKCENCKFFSTKQVFMDKYGQERWIFFRKDGVCLHKKWKKYRNRRKPTHFHVFRSSSCPYFEKKQFIRGIR